MTMISLSKTSTSSGFERTTFGTEVAGSLPLAAPKLLLGLRESEVGALEVSTEAAMFETAISSAIEGFILGRAIGVFDGVGSRIKRLSADENGRAENYILSYLNVVEQQMRHAIQLLILTMTKMYTGISLKWQNLVKNFHHNRVDKNSN